MNILWKSESWRWIVTKTRDSKPFFFTFAMVCGVIPGIVGYGVMQVTNSRNEKLESHLRNNSRPETRVCSFPLYLWSLLIRYLIDLWLLMCLICCYQLIYTLFIEFGVDFGFNGGLRMLFILHL